MSHFRYPPTPHSGSIELDDNKSLPPSPGLSEHLTWVIEHHRELERYANASADAEFKVPAVIINGHDLSIAELVAVATHRAPVEVSSDSTVTQRVHDSVEFLKQHLTDGNVVYGINTGYGGSADTRSQNLADMQRGLIQHHNSAVLLHSDVESGSIQANDAISALRSHALPRTVVRASMLARCNSLMRGHSAVRLQVIESIVTLLNKDYIPIVPLRGSISASGDLTPLSYIAGALEGNSDIFLSCRIGDVLASLPANQALQRAGIPPIVMDPKEGLGLMNGTAVSCAAASLALHETQYLVLAMQGLTAMCTEALRGSSDNYHPFISQARPHAGQSEVAMNIARQLQHSQLVVGKDARTAGLYQDRYALRTAPQWIGPQLEDLLLASRQLSTELNATTDNPLVDAVDGHVHHGGNFQAVSVTSAMEKTRLVLQMLGKLQFAQSSELINPMLNQVGSPNLCFDEPSVSFTFKGVDINMAAYYSELGYLANPVSTHVQSAEMHNQAVNSLALVSARYTLEAVEVLSLMTAAYLYTACQALDLHVMYIEYMADIERKARRLFEEFSSPMLTAETIEATWSEVDASLRAGLANNRNKETPERAQAAADATLAPFMKALLATDSLDALKTLQQWPVALANIITDSVKSTRIRFAESPTTEQYLGHGSATLYRCVRHELGVPLHKGLIEHPTQPGTERDGVKIAEEAKVTIGTRIGTIYEALRGGKMREVLVKSML
jgi:phenylalanine ammonia-lyase